MENFELLLLIFMLIGLGVFGVRLKKHFKINDTELKVAQATLYVLRYIVDVLNVKNEEKIKSIITACIQALQYVDDLEDAEYDIETKKILIKDHSIKLCSKLDIKIDNEDLEIIDHILDFIFNEENKMKEKGLL